MRGLWRFKPQMVEFDVKIKNVSGNDGAYNVMKNFRYEFRSLEASLFHFEAQSLYELAKIQVKTLFSSQQDSKIIPWQQLLTRVWNKTWKKVFRKLKRA